MTLTKYFSTTFTLFLKLEVDSEKVTKPSWYINSFYTGS